MDLRTPVSVRRHVGAVWLVFAALVAGGCNRSADHVPNVQGKKPVAAEATPLKPSKPEGFALASANAEPHDGQLSLTLAFTEPLVGTQTFDTLIASFKALHAYLDKEGIKPTGAAMTIYTKTDETGFDFEAAYPIAAAPASPPPDKIAVGQAPAGKALKFVHRGAYDAMDTTYETITNFLDDHSIDAKDMFIEQYATDPLVSNPDRLVIDIYVPIK